MPHLAEIYALASQQPSAANDALLLGYALEGVRLSPSPSKVHFEATNSSTVFADNNTAVSVQAGDRVTISSVCFFFLLSPLPPHSYSLARNLLTRFFLSYQAEANRDPNAFPEPDTVNPRRPQDKYIHFASGTHAFLGKEVTHAALTEMFRAVFKRKGLKRVPGPQGELKKVDGGYMREDWGSIVAYPVTMKVIWDEV